jgi:DNA ligase (NAD+)
MAYVIIDGTLIPIDRIAADRPFAAEEKTTVLAHVVWDVGKTGKIAPPPTWSR